MVYSQTPVWFCSISQPHPVTHTVTTTQLLTLLLFGDNITTITSVLKASQ